MAINSDVKIEINLSELVAIRASFLGEQLSEDEFEGIANELRLTGLSSSHKACLVKPGCYISHIFVSIEPFLDTC